MAEEEQSKVEINKAGGGHGDCPYRKQNNFQQNENKETGVSETSSSPSPLSTEKSTTNAMNKGKSCKGCLYYSSTLKSNSRNPLCVGLTRSLPNGTKKHRCL